MKKIIRHLEEAKANGTKTFSLYMKGEKKICKVSQALRDSGYIAVRYNENSIVINF